MNILQRLSRICKADIHGLVDKFEDKELLLKQYLRDMAEALTQKEVFQKNISQSRHAAAQRLATTNQEIEKIDQDLEVALKHDKDSIARHLIRKLRPISELRTQMQKHIENLDHELARCQTSIDQQRLQFEQLKLRATDFIDHYEQNKRFTVTPDFVAAHYSQALSDEAVEHELIQRKEALFQNKGVK